MIISAILKQAYEKLKLVKIESYIIDSQLLLSKVINKDKIFIMTNRNYELSEIQVESFNKLIALREKNMPVKYLLGSSEFMGIDFIIKEGVLIPRPDTEVLVENLLDIIRENKFKRICDVCCGSGAIGLSIAKYLDFVFVTCCDISEAAIEISKLNVNKLELDTRVNVIKSDLLDFAFKDGELFDVIVSNPPYIKEIEIQDLMKDVKDYEPYIALNGGEDGLDFYRKITLQSKTILRRGGIIAYEIGYNQRVDVSNILINSNFDEIKCLKDLSGLDRVITATFRG